MSVSFKSRVRNMLIEKASLYEALFVGNDYLIYSTQFSIKQYYVIRARRDNFLHLTGVRTDLSASEFYSRCLTRNLLEDDFSICNKQQKGSIKRKLQVIDRALSFFDSSPFSVEERFKKNKVSCVIATADNLCTMGFVGTKRCVPMTLLKGNQLKAPLQVDALLRKPRNAEKFSEIIYINEDKKDTILAALAEQVADIFSD